MAITHRFATEKHVNEVITNTILAPTDAVLYTPQNLTDEQKFAKCTIVLRIQSLFNKLFTVDSH